MSLTRTDTGQTATPIAELEKRSNAYRDMTDNQLLREALAKSNERCNDLIERQNTLIEDLTEIVQEIKNDAETHTYRLIDYTAKQTEEIRRILEEEKKIRSDVGNTVRSAASSTFSEVKQYGISTVDEAVKAVKKEIEETGKVMEKQRNEYREQSLFQTFFFWLTPILLVVQIILIIVLLFNG